MDAAEQQAASESDGKQAVSMSTDALYDAVVKAGLDATLVATLTQWIAGSLKEDQYARLDQIGIEGEGGIPLSRVFVDLPVNGGRRESPESGFIQEMIARGPQSVSLDRRIPRSEMGFPGEFECEPSGFALIGGPGQGKTTLTQFLCQMHRAPLLASRRAEQHPAVQRVLAGMLDQPLDNGLSLPVTGAIPWAVVFRDFAPWLDRNRREASASLAQYLAEQVNRVLEDVDDTTSPRITTEYVRALVRHWPSVIVLDGLDEVPDPDTRSMLLASIRHFLQEVAEVGAKSLIVATTRPQGYRDEFAGLRLDVRNLEPLTVKYALHYAERLVRVRYHDRPDQRRKVLDRLRYASEEESTARLLTSPLQVTLMATLVERIGRAPTERWTLFRDYYKIIYEREMERGGPLSDLLTRYRSYIDRIHTRVGLLLQVESEAGAGARALMPQSRLREVVDEALAEEGIGTDERERLAAQILQATTDRIVLLVQAQKEEYGFEIRSLQEFMAAWELTNSNKGDSILDARLMHIARSANFRNVFLFAASRAFQEMSRMRDVIVDQICQTLNDAPDDEPLRVLRAGSVLALELLEEGSVLNQPKYARKLMTMACRLFERPPSPHHIRLAKLNEPSLDDILRSALETRLALPQAWERRSAWVTVLEMLDQGREWPEQLADTYWPTTGEEKREVISVWEKHHRGMLEWRSWLIQRARQELNDYTPRTFPDFSPFPGRTQSSDPKDWVEVWSNWRFGLSYLNISGHDVSEGLEIRARLLAHRPSDENVSVVANAQDVPHAWMPVVAIARFVQQPSRAMLASTLRAFAADPEQFGSLKYIAHNAPWPLASCINMAQTVDELRQWIDWAEQGRLRDLDDWLAAEVMWRKRGTDVDVVAARVAARACLPEAFPWGGFSWNIDHRLDESIWLERNLIRFYQETNDDTKKILANAIMSLVMGFDGGHEFAPEITFEQLRDLLPFTTRTFLALDFIVGFVDSKYVGWHEVIDMAGRRFDFMRYYESARHAFETIERLVSAYGREPSRWGLLNILANLLLEIATSDDDDETPTWPTDLPKIDIASIDVPHLRDAAIAVTLARRDLTWSEIEFCLEQLVESARGQRYPRLALWILKATPIDAALKERAFLTFYQRIVDATESSTVLSMLESLARRESKIDDPNTWDYLRLPLPRPKARRTSSPPPTPSPQIEQIRIENLRVFDQFALEPTPREDGLGQWLVFLGENGVGKTTLLRALVFALADDATVTTLLQQSYAPWRRHPAQADTFAKTFTVSRGVTYHREIEQTPEGDRVRLSNLTDVHRPFIFAYGCRRGSALGGPDRSVSFMPIGAVATLFDEPAHLVHAETWLQGLALSATKDQHVETLYTSILAALQTILGVERIYHEHERFWAKGAAIGEAPLSALSDGYLTTTGWVIDLIARWIERMRQRDKNKVISKGFLEEMTGIVLIDELDLHLHPKWQCEVIRRTREIFPRMTFIVTTHNPLTLLGTQPGEVYVLRRLPNGGKTRIEPILEDLPKGVRADQILTGPWFGLESTLDPETLGYFKEHAQLLQEQGPTNEARRKELENILRTRLGSFADTALERLALGVAAQIMTEEYKEITPSDREKLRSEVLRLVKQRRANPTKTS